MPARSSFYEAEPPRCGVCHRRCRNSAEVLECERAHKDDPCWRCGALRGHAPSCPFATQLVAKTWSARTTDRTDVTPKERAA